MHFFRPFGLIWKKIGKERKEKGKKWKWNEIYYFCFLPLFSTPFYCYFKKFRPFGPIKKKIKKKGGGGGKKFGLFVVKFLSRGAFFLTRCRIWKLGYTPSEVSMSNRRNEKKNIKLKMNFLNYKFVLSRLNYKSK